MSAEPNDAGSVTLWVLFVAAVTLVLVGLVVDGGVLLRARSDAFGLAAAAGRVAAQELDDDALARGEVALTPEGARQAAQRYLAARGATGEIEVAEGAVTITVTRPVQLHALRPIQTTVTASATIDATGGVP